MFTLQLTHMIAFLAAILLIGKCYAHPTIRQRQEARPLCVGCGDECDKCEFGFTRSTLCRILECRRGPGQLCGGPSESWGVCGDGMFCNNCNQCSGCSLDSLTCYEKTCLEPSSNLDSRSHLDILDGFLIERVDK